MFQRLTLIGRHLPSSRPISLVRPRVAAGIGSALRPGAMTSTIQDRTTRMIQTAACLIIGDEVLGGKTVDTNSPYFAKYCFNLGIELKRVEVIPDDEADIIEATRRMSSAYDFVVTAGGIGPTHDDITYASIGKAFGLPLTLHEDAFQRMKRISRPHPSQPNFSWDTPSPALEAKLRMVRLPLDTTRETESQVLFVSEALWVPICVVNGNVHILPGVPRLFEGLLEALKPLLRPRLADPDGKGIHRLTFSTPLAESEVAAYLTELAAKAEPRGVKVGSYPQWGENRNNVTLVGRDLEFMQSLVPEVEKGVQGELMQQKQETK